MGCRVEEDRKREQMYGVKSRGGQEKGEGVWGLGGRETEQVYGVNTRGGQEGEGGVWGKD